MKTLNVKNITIIIPIPLQWKQVPLLHSSQIHRRLVVSETDVWTSRAPLGQRKKTQAGLRLKLRSDWSSAEYCVVSSEGLDCYTHPEKVRTTAASWHIR